MHLYGVAPGAAGRRLTRRERGYSAYLEVYDWQLRSANFCFTRFIGTSAQFGRMLYRLSGNSSVRQKKPVGKFTGYTTWRRCEWST
ncbi:hypothetical protein LSCM4_02341 [Leishmania orientalis]|uniref:Uncharacterized protein n=1 Tax=Leishmania orientalis TaxID=2249476 RepID=A0A836GS47_9TRYP|nr:hypothetical protein LSCM4_02341 [Leishmania orientalis]